MLIVFSIEKSRQTLREQWLYLVQRINKRSSSYLKKSLLLLCLFSGMYMLFYVLTPVNEFIVFKVVPGVMIILFGMFIIVYYLFHLFRVLRNRRRLNQVLTLFSDEDLKYQVQIDNEKVTLSSNDHTIVHSWTDFEQFGIYNETIYIFNSVTGINSLYWNKNEMGNEAYSALLDLIKDKSLKQAF